jgi:hypothetical protein
MTSAADAHPAVVDAGADVAGAVEVTEGVATGALAEGVATDGVAAGVLERAVAVRVAAAGLDAVGVLGEHAATTAIKAKAAPTVAIGRSIGSDLKLSIARSLPKGLGFSY